MIGFHRFLIGTAILFCAVLAAWSFDVFRDRGGASWLALAIGFAVATVTLGYYLRHLDRFLWRRR
jgi:hypothetical protein